jgi:mannosylfructose-phosphate synthase
MVSTHGYFDPVPQLGRTDTGGQVVYVLELAKSLAATGRLVDIYTRWFDRSKPQIEAVADCPNVKIVRIAAGPWEFIPKEEIYEVLPELAANMVKLIQERGFSYDVFHGHYVDGGIVAIDVARELAKPVFFTAHSLGAWKRSQLKGDPTEMEQKFRFEHRIAQELSIFKAVNAQSVTSPLQHEKLLELYGFTADNVQVISPGVDVHRFRPLRLADSQRAAGLHEHYIFCLSRLDTNKGHDFLLNAFEEVRRKVPDIHLVIGGGSPKPLARERGVLAMIRRIIDSKQMNDRVQVIGYVPDDDLVSLYQHAELFVLSSLFEPFGMTALEAMACETPVVASRFGGIRNVISSDVDGLLIDPRDTSQFADGVIALLADPERARRLGQAGYQKVLEQYSWEAIANKTLAFYEQFI